VASCLPLFGKRQLDIKRGVGAFLALEPDAAVVQLDQHFDDGHAEAGGFLAPQAQAAGAGKALEQAGLQGGWDADAIVGDGEQQVLGVLVPRDRELAAVGREREGVANKVVDDLQELVLVDVGVDAGVRGFVVEVVAVARCVGSPLVQLDSLHWRAQGAASTRVLD
jgi:hypothetical protein